MTTHDALLAAVLAKPDDDLTRLVYADWLEENGEPERAEFIRVQVKLAASEGEWQTGNWLTKAMRRELELVNRFGREWAGLPEFGGKLEFRRGFVAEVRCDIFDWCGGECHQCAGTGRSFPIGGPSIPCRRCGGSLVTGAGPEVVRRHPVERVVLVGVVTESTIPGLSIVTQDSAGELFAIAFPSANWVTAHRGHVEGRGETLDRRISAAAIAWAKSQNQPRIGTSPVSVDFVTG